MKYIVHKDTLKKETGRLAKLCQTLRERAYPAFFIPFFLFFWLYFIEKQN